ncbi:MAG: hypothetical protein ABIQ85_11770, partial [Cypionkella sp.]
LGGKAARGERGLFGLGHRAILRQRAKGRSVAATKPVRIVRSSICVNPEIHFHSCLTISHIRPEYSRR